MGAPDITLYFKATILAQTKHLWANSLDTSWKQLETCVWGSNPKYLLSFSTLRQHHDKFFMDTLTATSRVWNAVMQPLKGIPYSALQHLPILCLHLASPDLDLHSWDSLGIHYLSYLFAGNHLKSVQDLCHTYHLCRTDFYKYLRVCHIALQLIPHLALHAPGLPTWLIEFDT